MASQNASSVVISGGTIDGTTIGGTTPAAGHFTTLSVSSPTPSVPAVTSRSALNTVYQNTTGYNVQEQVSVLVNEYYNPPIGFDIGTTSSPATAIIPVGLHSGGSIANQAYNWTFIVPAGWSMEMLCTSSSDCAGVTITSWTETTIP
jgi:hypothetical protein